MITKEVYLENILFNDKKLIIKENLGENELEIILGFILPELKVVTDIIVRKVKDEIAAIILTNENNLRKNKNKGVQLELDIFNYKEDIKRLKKITNLEIENFNISFFN